MSYDIGDTVPLGVEVVDENGTATTPSTISVTITQPDGSTSSPTPTALSVGRYSVDFVPTLPGVHSAVWTSTSPSTSWEDAFDVFERPTPALCSLARFKEHLRKTDTAEDEELRGYLAAATVAVEHHVGEVVARRSFTERLRADCRESLLLAHYPALSVTSIVAADGSTTWDAANFLAESTGLLTRKSGPKLRGLVDVTYVAGARVVSANRVLAALVIAAHLWEQKQHSHLSGGPTYDEQILTPSGLGFAIPHRAVELLGTRGSMIV